MNLLFLDAYFYPENIAFSHIEWDVMEGLMDAGHHITVVCPTPSRGISEEVFRAYRNQLEETYRGVRICRFKAPREGRNPILRAIRYFYCNLKGVSVAKRFRDTDAVFAVSTPPTQGYFAGKLSKKLGVPLIYSLQDLFPDSLVTTGLSTQSSLLYRIGDRIAKKTYEKCAKIIVLSHFARQALLSKGVPQKKLLTVSNWIDTDTAYPVKREDNRIFDEFSLDREKFYAVYAGNLGASQGTEVILRAARLCGDYGEIRFIIFGGGSEYERIQGEIQNAGLQNLRMYPLLPADRIPEVYSMGDVALITCKKGVGKTAVPSKLYSIMACETPIVASFDTDSELCDILKEAVAGVCVEPEDEKALADAVIAAYENRGGSTSDACGREYVKNHASKEKCVKEYVKCFEQTQKNRDQ
ncbi:MAG: glycosyltransferase family 4 protein [Ruminococcus sp.]|nr:glycosyltransferase family 4 protein [Ruminococcus sp.]